jgi:purine-binding chemotaxis protein CheW
MSVTSHHVPSRQLATFLIEQRLYGIDVMCVQEVTQAPKLTLMRLAPPFVKGLINLRGQIATAIGLRELFGSKQLLDVSEPMTIVCADAHSLLSLIVDSVGDVIEVSEKDIERVPATVGAPIRHFMDGVCMHNHELLSIIDIEKITRTLNNKEVSP